MEDFKRKFSWVRFFNRNPEGPKRHNLSFKEKSQEIFLKLSQGFVLPIALLPLGGLIRGIGNIIMNVPGASHLQYTIGSDIDLIGAIIFSSLPVFFAIAVAATFTNWSGSAAFAAVLGYLIFCTFQTPFLQSSYTDADGIAWYHILFYNKVSSGLITQNMGINSLNTSVISGMIIGGITAKLHNLYKDVRLPNLISFFNGPRLVNIYVYFICIVLSLVFLLVWPLIGIALVAIGNGSAKLPVGMDSWIYGMVERALIPTGLHNVWNGVFYWTPAGGELTINTHFILDGKDWTFAEYFTSGPGIAKHSIFESVFFPNGPDKPAITIFGDQNMWFADYKLGIPFDALKAGSGLNLARCLDGRFPFMMFGLMGATAAIILRSESVHRKRVAGLMISAAFTTFLTGTTEPVEYTFVWTAPWLYYFIHVPLDGISWWLMNGLGAHVGLTYSGGLIDYAIYGIVPDVLGMHTRSWLVPVIGIPMGCVYFVLFYWAIKRFNARTPGREGIPNQIPPRKLKSIKTMLPTVVADCGGVSNIDSMLSCATSIRLSVKDSSKVNTNAFLELGAINTLQTSEHSFRIIFKEDSYLISDAYNRLYGERASETDIEGPPVREQIPKLRKKE